MKISYEITNDGDVVKTVTGSELRARFGVGPSNPIFTEQLVQKYNLTNECADNPERIRQIVSYE